MLEHGCGLGLCAVVICAWKLNETEFAFIRKCRRAYWRKSCIDGVRENRECCQCWFIWLKVQIVRPVPEDARRDQTWMLLFW